MLADCFAFPVRIGREKDRIARLGHALKIRNDLFVSTLFCIGNYLVRRLEIVFDIDTKLSRRQVLDVPYRRHHGVIRTQIFIDRFRLCGRFYYY